MSVKLHCKGRKGKSGKKKATSLQAQLHLEQNFQSAFWSASLATRREILAWELQKPDHTANSPRGKTCNTTL